MKSMQQQQRYTNCTTSSCPAWCQGDTPSDDGSYGPMHEAAIEVGGRVFDFMSDASGDERPYFMFPDLHDGLLVEDARAFALGLLEACDLIEGDRATLRVARRAYARMVEAPMPADTLEAIAAAIGIHWSELVMVDLDNVPPEVRGGNAARS